MATKASSVDVLHKTASNDIMAVINTPHEVSAHTGVLKGRAYTWVDSVAKTKALLESLAPGLDNFPSSGQPSLYVDLEGIKLDRNGYLSILQLYFHPSKHTYLIDIHTLSESAFATTSTSGLTLKAILESTKIHKVFFDVRNDSDALFGHYGISLAGIQDLQLMEIASRVGDRRRVNGLAKCIEYDTGMTYSEKIDWKRIKDAGVRIFSPQTGGSYEVFNQRPLSPALIEYCVQDVKRLPELWRIYNTKLTKSWKDRVMTESARRVLSTQQPSYIGQGSHKAFGPTAWC